MNDAPDLSAYDPAFMARAWQAGRLEWKLHDSQMVIHDQIEALPVGAKDVVLLCSRRFGKSFYGCVRAVMSCLQSPRPRLIRIIGPEVKQTEMIVSYNMAKITAELNQIGLRGLVEQVKSDKMYRVGGSAIFLGGYDSQEDSLRGGEADEIIVEETGSSDPDDYIYQMKSVLKPQLLKTRGRMLHLTTPPKIEDHPFVLDTIPAAMLDGAFRKFTIYDDPLATPEIIADAIKDCGGEHTIDFRREYLCEVIRDPSIVVVPDFNEAKHVYQMLPPGMANGQITIDFGGVRDFTVALAHWYDFQTNKIVFWDERWFPPNTTTDVIVRGVREMERALPESVTVESRRADAPGQLMIDLIASGYEVQSVPKDDWQAAINNFALGFTRSEILVHPRCRLFIQTLKSGTFNKQRTDFNRSQSLGHMDAIAAGMYGYRSQLRDNPFSGKQGLSQWTFKPQPSAEESTLASAIQPKTFANDFGSDSFKPKRFGSFK